MKDCHPRRALRVLRAMRGKGIHVGQRIWSEKLRAAHFSLEPFRWHCLGPLPLATLTRHSAGDDNWVGV